MKVVDLRSDTVTLPSPQMRRVMFEAELGDDVFGEDPTVNELERLAAELMGKESAMLVVSGTMGNLVCMLTHCQRGDEIILGDKSHMFLNEAGGVSAVGGIHPHIVKNQEDGTMGIEDIESAIRGKNLHWPRTRVICLENTHNYCYGAPLSVEYMAEVFNLARKHNLVVHLDGARLFNAAVALKQDIKKFTQYANSVSFCLSKGLAAPVGSVVCGDRDFIAEARRNRKLLGGGMRQAGIIAAPGVISIKQMVTRLAEDHKNARRLAEGIVKIPGLKLDLERIKTNIIYFELDIEGIDPDQFVKSFDNRGVKFLCTGPRRFRMVTHYGIEEEDISYVLETLVRVTNELSKR